MRLKPHGTYFRCLNINSRYSQIPLHEDIEELLPVFLSVGKFVFMFYLKGEFLFHRFLISIMARRSKTWRESKKNLDDLLASSRGNGGKDYTTIENIHEQEPKTLDNLERK